MACKDLKMHECKGISVVVTPSGGGVGGTVSSTVYLNQKTRTIRAPKWTILIFIIN